MSQILIIHHKPGSPLGYAIIQKHAHKLAQALQAHVTPLTIEEYLAQPQPPNTLVAAYLILRGDHYDEVREKAEKLGHRFLGTIPLELTTRALCQKHGSKHCTTLTLYYYRARRRAERQSRDLERLAQLVKSKCGITLALVRAGHGENHGSGQHRGACTDTLALLPTRNGEGSLLEYMENELLMYFSKKAAELHQRSPMNP